MPGTGVGEIDEWEAACKHIRQAILYRCLKRIQAVCLSSCTTTQKITIRCQWIPLTSALSSVLAMRLGTLVNAPDIRQRSGLAIA
jgi:hypothetical protein